MKSEVIESAKRTSKERSGVHAWHPYYAGYSERFVTSAIDYLGLKKGVVLDPWSGSGVTNYVCERMGLLSIGFDINPVMAYFSAAKQGLAANLIKPELIFKFLEGINLDESRDDINDEILDIISPSLSKQLMNLLNSILEYKSENCKINENINRILKSPSCVDPFQSFLLSCFFITSRELAGYKNGSNPTWFSKIEKRPRYKQKTIKERFISIMKRMLDDLSDAKLDFYTDVRHLNCIGDSKDMPLKSETIDAVITSPPYLTRIDYAMSTRLELMLVSNSDNLRKVRENTMGAPVIKKCNLTASKKWGVTTNRLLKDIENHHSKASKSYYLKNMIQYFDDAYLSLEEIKRVLKKKAKALIVVQSSYYKEIEMPLGDIYMEMGKNLGFNSKRIFREVVKGHMAHVNTNSSKYKKNKIYYEDVIELTK